MRNKFYLLDRIDKFFLIPSVLLIIILILPTKGCSQERDINGSKELKRTTSGTKIYQSLKNLDDSKARAEYNKRKVGYRPIITWLPQGAAMNVGPAVVSEDRRYIRMTINPFFSSIIGFKTFTYRK